MQIDPSATEIEIKKAYKRLAKLYHPDLNQGDPDAQTKFIILNQAYRCLTDEEVMEKCKAYGNPDGQSNFQVAIALPSALLNKKNRGIILAMFFLIMLVFLPITVWMWYTDKEQYDNFGVNRESTKQTLAFMRNENITTKNVLEMVACSVEMQKVRVIKVGQGQALNEVILDLQDQRRLPQASADGHGEMPIPQAALHDQQLPQQRKGVSTTQRRHGLHSQKGSIPAHCK